MKNEIKMRLKNRLKDDGLHETGIKGVRLFKVSESIQCAPAVYEPTVIAILSGSKEAILDGQKHIYDNEKYMCCTMSLPVEAGTPNASPEDPLLGVSITLDSKMMTELALEMENISGAIKKTKASELPKGLSFASWDNAFSDALWRLLQLEDNSVDSAMLGEGRLRELYYAVLKGEAGESVRRSFGVGNEIARSIEYLSHRLDQSVTIDELASKVGMSRAVFHRKFKQATSLSPIQFMKSMRLNNAAMNIATGMNVNQAAMSVGYVSSSQFSREFKRLYGQSPKQWISSQGHLYQSY
ncbi:putative AraC family transcriptional regulator [Vibrio ezurae NBRC 102218]|uniref:Putative AraC family transcriptional regulator n=2 Tax=Vibrio ezurae TaxID=252583 RepID=U3AZ45_9VIBR|nr:putative AraC family transcriptional regulator [Vibrio ezurae NBRC 102218]